MSEEISARAAEVRSLSRSPAPRIVLIRAARRPPPRHRGGGLCPADVETGSSPAQAESGAVGRGR